MSGSLHAPLLAPEHAAKLLDEVVYERVLALVDLDGLYRFEQELWFAFHECGIEGDHVPELVKDMLDRALVRALGDPRRYATFGPPECSLCDEAERDEKLAKQRKAS